MTTSTRDSQGTRKRLLAAAFGEFAQFGIAGARVDRIAAAASSNKAQIYHYFGSKDALFDAVMAQVVEQVVRQAPIDTADLPGYAGTLFDGYLAEPMTARLVTWQRLERDQDGPLVQAIVNSNTDKVAAIAAAQQQGVVSTAHDPDVLLVLVLHLAATWVNLSPEYQALTGHLRDAQRRQIVVDTVRALTAP